MVGFQNNVEPQTEQKPRRTFSDDWYHLTHSAPRTWRAVRLTLIPVQKLPVCFLHCVQWQASGECSSGAWISSCTAPQRQLACITFGLLGSLAIERAALARLAASTQAYATHPRIASPT